MHSAPRMKRETRIPPIRGRRFRPKFYGNGVIPCQKCRHRSTGSWLHYNFAAGSFYETFSVKINDKFRYLDPILEKLGVTHNLGWWLAGKPMVDFVFALLKLFFAIYYGSGVMRRNVYSADVFTGGRPLCTQILPGQGRPPSTIRGVKKTRDTGLPGAKTASFCIPSFSHNTGVWRTEGRTDRRTDRRICHSVYSRLQS